MGWLSVVTVSEPIFPTLVRAFYSRVTYAMGGPIISTVRGVKICLDPKSICHIFYIVPIGLRVYESNTWPTMPRFELRKVIQRICGLPNAQGMGKPSAHSLTVINKVLHHMICSIFLPRGGHRDEVSYYEAFLYWLGDRSTWGTQWWCTWSHVSKAQLTHSLMVVSSPECSRMSALTRVKRQTLRPPTLMICMMISLWGGWNLRKPQMVFGYGE